MMGNTRGFIMDLQRDTAELRNKFDSNDKKIYELSLQVKNLSESLALMEDQIEKLHKLLETNQSLPAHHDSDPNL